MKIPANISNVDLFKLIEENLNWTYQRQQIFYITTYVQFKKFGYVSPRQRSVLFKIAAKIAFKSGRSKNFDTYKSDHLIKLRGL